MGESDTSTSQGTPATNQSGTQSEQASSSPSYQSQNSQRFSGTLIAVDQNSRSLTIKGDAGERNFTVDNNAQVRSGDDNDRKLEDLKTGSQVTVEYTEEGGKPVAKVVHQQSDSSREKDKSSDTSSSSSSSDQDK